MAIVSIVLAVAAGAQQIPDVPPAVMLIEEKGAYVIRTLDGGMPVYTHAKDEPNKSNCTGSCVTAWPIVAAPAGAKPMGKWTIVTRPDGKTQWAYDGKPLYTFIRDTEAMPTGDGLGGEWHLLPTLPK